MKKLLVIIVLVISLALIGSLYYFKPTPQRKKPKASIPLIETIQLTKRDYPITYKAFGTVSPAKELKLVTEVQGVVLKKNPELLPGGILSSGELIAQIDPTHYQLIARDRRALVTEAENLIELEEGRQIIARQEWELLKNELETTDKGKSLVLRKPQMKNVTAQLDAANSRLDQALLDIEKTTITAPFNALVVDSFIEEGTYISSHSPVAQLVSTDNYWIKTSIPASLLPYLRIPKTIADRGSDVAIKSDVNGDTGIERTGSILRLLGEVNPENKMAMIIVTIPDPLNLQTENGQPTGILLLGSYVHVTIDCGILHNVFSIPRGALYNENTIWLHENNRLKRQEVSILWQRQDDLLVAADLEGQHLVTSRMLNPLEGMNVVTSSSRGKKDQNQEK